MFININKAQNDSLIINILVFKSSYLVSNNLTTFKRENNIPYYNNI